MTVGIISPSSLPMRPGDRIKTDRRGTILPARLACNGDLAPVHVPDRADEVVRDLIRDWVFRPLVEALQVLRGIQLIAAMSPIGAS